jgi:guanylate kinase
LIERATETDAEQRLRLETSTQEMQAAAHFDFVVENETGKLEQTARRVVEIIVAEKARRARDLS